MSSADLVSRMMSEATPPSCDMKPRATLSSAVVEETDHHVITFPGSYSSYRSAAMPRQSRTDLVGIASIASKRRRR
jgi:hypothetical protein